ncbi:MAG TPA: ABC transporter substrate-binding protein [Methylomirabilota bacterium]|nr:ABC transporter substrate-binding protein [Methylomirabilota bacterium]
MKILRTLTVFLLIFCLSYPAAAQEKKSTPLTVGYSAISGSFAPLWIAFDQGFFAKYGLDVKLTYIQGNRVMMAALTAGEIQLYQGGAEGLIRLISGGGDGIFIASQYNFVGHYVLITDPKITRLEDLRGQRIALDPTSPTYGYMLKVLEHAGMRKEDVSFVQFGTAGQPERAMAVLRKQAAATILTAPNTYAAEKQGLKRFSIIRDLGIRQLITVTGTPKRFLREKRETAEAFLRGYVEGLSYVMTHRDVTMKVIGKYTRQHDAEVLGKFYDDLVPDLPRIPYIEDGSARATVEAMQAQGPPLPKVDVKTLYDNSLLKSLETEGSWKK